MNKIDLAERMNRVNESATMAVDARAKQLAAEGKTIYNLTAGELASDTPDYIQEAVSKKLHHNKYTPPAGLPELRRAIAESSREFYGLDWIEPANVVVTASTKPAMYASLLALVNHGDEVILPTPAWPTHSHLIGLVGGKVIEVPLAANFDLDVDTVMAAITPRTKAVVLNSPHNPTGAVFSKASLRKLAAGLGGTNVTVIADDIYVKLVYDKQFAPVPTCGFERLIIVNGFSKSQALTGWRIGYLIANEATAKAATSLLSHITGNAPVPSQHAALAALEHGDRPPAETVKALERQRALVDEELKGSGIKYHLPGGAFYYFLDLRDVTKNTVGWCERLLETTGVVLVPGEAFGAPGFARLTFTAPEPTLKKALRELRNFITKRPAA